MRKYIATFCALFFIQNILAQQLIPLESMGSVSLRGLSVVNDSVLWVSGSKGTVARSINGGKNWERMQVIGYEQRDFRDIEAMDEQTAIIIAVDTPAILLKTTNGGKEWKLVYENKTPGMFLDALAFWNEKSGIVIGDPIDGKIFIARTVDGGDSWRSIPHQLAPIAEEGEALFAASGSNIIPLNAEEAVFVTGGKQSRLFLRDKKINLPLLQGQTTTGANAIAVWNENNMIAVGGDFAKDSSRAGNCVIIRNKGKKMITPTVPPFGYRSSVTYVNATRLITCGTSGVDVSEDGGMRWRNLSATGYHVVKKAKKGNAIFLAGGNGRLARLYWP